MICINNAQFNNMLEMPVRMIIDWYRMLHYFDHFRKYQLKSDRDSFHKLLKYFPL
jgi:hypothetical protein